MQSREKRWGKRERESDRDREEWCSVRSGSVDMSHEPKTLVLAAKRLRGLCEMTKMSINFHFFAGVACTRQIPGAATWQCGS